jgi:hypothetical protein
VYNMSNTGNSNVSPTCLHHVPRYDSTVEGIFIFCHSLAIYEWEGL